MLIYSFICSIIFSVVMVTFIIASIFVVFKNKKYCDEAEEMFNGFKTYDLTDSLGGANDKDKEE